MKNKMHIYIYNNSSIKYHTLNIILSRNKISSNYTSFLSQEIYILEHPLAVKMINYEIFQIFHTRIDKSVYLRYIRK